MARSSTPPSSLQTDLRWTPDTREAPPEPQYDQIGGTFIGGAGDDEIHGGPFNDIIIGNGTPNPFLQDDDTLHGEDGHDTIDGMAGNDSLYGGNGDDTVFGGAGNDLIDGGDGEDKLYGGAGADRIFGGDDHDWINGDHHELAYTRGYWNDTIDGGGGEDWIYGMYGHDTIHGGEANDRLFGDGYDAVGNDILYGDAGDDRLWGGGGNDMMFGGDGTDYLHGGDGDDTYDGGNGTDMLVGGAGADYFIAGTDGVPDIIENYAFLDGDSIQGSYFITGGNGTESYTYVYNSSDVMVFILPEYHATNDGITLIPV